MPAPQLANQRRLTVTVSCDLANGKPSARNIPNTLISDPLHHYVAVKVHLEGLSGTPVAPYVCVMDLRCEISMPQRAV
ncbi:hypothetical protein SRHO_G00036550 [Serrasalmus rhombeus]